MECSSHAMEAMAAIQAPAKRRARMNMSHDVARCPITHSTNAAASPDSPSFIGSSTSQQSPGGQTVSGAGTCPDCSCDSYKMMLVENPSPASRWRAASSS
jgi:hypothetical protein